jgi:hypothetical protein
VGSRKATEGSVCRGKDRERGWRRMSRKKGVGKT